MSKLSYEDLLEPSQCCGIDCPWTGVSLGVDMGCLPYPIDFVKHLDKGEILSCHSDYTKPCVGIVKWCKKNGIDIKELKLIRNN